MATVEERRKELIGTTADWAANPLVIGYGEIAFEVDDDNLVHMKVGDGVKTFDALDYLVTSLWETLGNVTYNAKGGPVAVGTSAGTDRLTVYGGNYSIGAYRAEVVTDGQNLGILNLGAIESTDTPATGVAIRGQAVGDWDSGNYGAEMTFLVTIENTTVLVPGMSLKSNGSLWLLGDALRIVQSRTPASASASGVTGEICWDADYIYVCVGVDTWKRAALASW